MMIRAIETVYKGYRFRSRLEARWAVFFDALGVKWEYEKEGYELGGEFISRWEDDDEPTWYPRMRYLPDFWLPEQDIWVEIKPSWNDEEGWPDMTKQFLLSKGSGKQVVTLCGEPGPVEAYGKGNPYQGWITGDYSYYWCECPCCGAVGIQFDGRSARNIHKEGCNAKTWGNGDKNYNLDSPRIIAAYTAARSARFEHGETP